MQCRPASAFGFSLALVASFLVAQKPQLDPQVAAQQRAQLALPDRGFDAQMQATNLAWQQFVQQAGGRWMSQWNRATNTPSAIWGTGLPLADWRGNTQEEARRQALRLLQERSDLLGLGQSEFRETIAARIGSNWSFVYDQFFAGIPVLDGRADVRVHRTGKVSMFGSVAFAIPAGFSTVPQLDELSATFLAWQALGLEPPTVRQPNDKRLARLVILGDANAAKSSPVELAWEIPVSAVDQEGKGPVGRYLIDAQRGRVLRYENDKHECALAGCRAPHRGFTAPGDGPTQPEAALPVVTGTVLGWTRLGTGATSALANIPLAGVQINVPGAGVVVTDSNGNFTANVNVVTNVTATLDGIHSQLIAGGLAPSVNATLTPGVPATIQFLTNAASQEDAAHTSTYHWTYAVNEFLRGILGNSPELAAADNVLPTVNIASTCNAYYTGNTINFYATGGSCNNTAFSSVVAHEWGHGIDDRYGGISQTNGLSEGWGDICSIYLLDFPTVGENFFTNGGFIRTGTNNRQYPTGSGVHAQGESWMGFAWKLREGLAVSLGNRAQAIAITNDIVLGTLPADATNQRDAVREVFLADDNDADLTNGTPNSVQLLAACALHNLPDPSQPGPANDECAGAIQVFAGANGPFDTSLSSSSSQPWPCAGGGSDLWYRFTALGSGSMTVDTCASANYDSALEIFSGTCGALVSLACNDDTCGLSSSVTVNVLAGQTYYIRLGGYAGAAGSSGLNISAPTGGFPASVASYGTGCYQTSRSFYELFPAASAMDLTGLSMTLAWTGSSYVALPLGSYVAPSPAATALVLADDTFTAVPLSGTLSYPGGTTTALEVCSNGFVSAASGNGVGYVPSASGWLGSVAARWGLVHDFYPGTVGVVKREQVGSVLYITWDNVRDFSGTATSTWQLQFDLASNNVTYVWQSMSTGGNAYLAGFTAAAPNNDLGSLNLSAAIPGGFTTGSANSLGLAQVSSVPVIGTQLTITTTNYTAPVSVGFVCFGVTGYNPGIDMGQFGAAGCAIHVNTDFNYLVVSAAGQSVLNLQIPNDPAFQAAVLNTQTFALSSGANQLGVTSSNGVALTFGY